MMSGAKKRVPKRRFKEFLNAGDWEQRKLGDVANIKTGSRNQQDSVTNGKYPFFIRSEKIEKLDTYDFDTEAILVPGDGRIGEIFHYYNGKFALHQRVYKVDDFKGVDAFYLLYLFQCKFKEHALRLNAQGTVPSLRLPMFTEWNISMPSLQEQICIGRLLNKIELMITLHQRKLDKLQATKKALLQEMFPEEGQDKPKRRFKGFTGAWEQRKLSELATMNARIGWQNLRTSEFLDSGDYLLITGTDFDNGRIKYNTCHYVEKKRFDQDTKIQLSTGSILITKDGTLGKVALIEELPKPATLNAGVFNVRVKDDAVLSYKYLYHYLKAPFLMKYVTANATGGTIKHLNQSILVDFPIPITEKQEQDRIAKLLDSLESIITLHQRKLDKLKNLKQAYLNEMFV